MIYLDLFASFFVIGLLTYGGGYSALPLIETTAVTEKGWLTAGELADMISISEISPGPFSLNCSTFVGMKLAGWPGAVVSTLGFLFPAAVIVLIMAVIFEKFRHNTRFRAVFDILNACIIAVLLNSAVHLFMNAVGFFPGIDWIALVIFTAAFLMLFRFKINPLWVMAASGLLGMLLYPR